MSAPAVAAVEPSGRLTTAHCTADAYGATIGDAATDDEIAALVAATELPEDVRAWRVGDVGRALAARHGADWLAHCPDIGIAEKSWRNRRTVAAAFSDPGTRRQFGAMGLSWGHFAAVASLPPTDADAMLWQAVGQGWTVAALRRALRGETPPAADPDPSDVSRIEFAAAAVRRWLEVEGLTLFSEVQVVSLAGAVLEAMARYDRRHPLVPVPFDPDDLAEATLAVGDVPL